MLNEIKRSFIQDSIEELHRMIDSTEKSIKEAQEEANYHIGAMQSRYDTFKEEAQYLVDAQKIRKLELESQLFECNALLEKLSNQNEIAINFNSKKLDVGDFCILSNDEEEVCFFILPFGNNKKINYENKEFIVVSYKAPLISPFMGKTKDEYADEMAHKLEDFYIMQIL